MSSDAERSVDDINLDTDQALSDADRIGADSDQTLSERDQALAGIEQAAADRDQVASDRDLAEGLPASPAQQHAHDVSKIERETTTVERAGAAILRTRAAAERLELAERRDEASRLRDLAAAARDRAADARDRLRAEIEPTGPAAEARAAAAAERARAAADRERAAADRREAALDRQRVREALSQAHLDELTGTYRRGLGTLELEREVNRARHSNGQLVLAFVDVDGLKEVNDRDGHAAGDRLLILVADTIRSSLRSYDPVVRFGGDEFVCAFSNFDLEGARRRFDEVQSALATAERGCSISVGFAALRPEDALEDLLARGDADLYRVKRSRGPCRTPRVTARPGRA